MNISFKNSELGFNMLGTKNINRAPDRELISAKSIKGYDNFNRNVSSKFQSADYNIGEAEKLQSGSIDVKEYKEKISFLQIFLDEFMEAAGSDGNSINNVVNKYNEIKDNLNKYCSSDELNEKTARLDNSFYGVARMIESRIISSYMKLKNIDPITEYGKKL